MTEEESRTYVDPETGVIEEIPEGLDLLYWAAQNALEAGDQADEWGARAGMFKGILVRGQEERHAAYGEAAVLITSSMRAKFDRERFAAWLDDVSADLTGEDLIALLKAATGFDPEAATLAGDEQEAFRAAIRRCSPKSPSKTFAKVTRVRKLAPKR